MSIYFHSKCNAVQLCGNIVVKRCACAEAAAAEATQLRALARADLRVPAVLGVQGDELHLEYIEGETVPDFLARMEAAPNEAAMRGAAQGLCDWLADFYVVVDHARSGENRGDVNGRNFIIIEGGSVYGVDFEERSFGSITRDVGRLLAFIRSYEPMRSQVKRRFANMFFQLALARFSLITEEIAKEYRAERRAMRARRQEAVQINQNPI